MNILIARCSVYLAEVTFRLHVDGFQSLKVLSIFSSSVMRNLEIQEFPC
jgi:hypothetical protein